MFRRGRKGQSTLEYAILIAVIVGGLVAMQYYVRRGYQGKLKSASDDMGEQYEPGKYTANFQINQNSQVRQTFQEGVSRTEHTADQTNTKTGTEANAAWEATGGKN
ncbi:MAG: hypothetical protein ACM3OC_09795 [Deltaproteobacteria bacterium]